jgi:hypothetical protein
MYAIFAAMVLVGCAAGCGSENGGDACEGVTCSGLGTCLLVADDLATCDCNAGYHAEGLNCVENPPDPCDGITCSDHGICFQDVNGDAACNCESGYRAEGLECVEADQCDPDYLRANALANGTVINSGVTLSSSTPIADILANLSQFDGQLVQIEGLVAAICDSQGCWASLQDPVGNQLLLKVTDGTVDFRTVTAIGRYMVGEGIFNEAGTHGSQVFIDDHGAVSGTISCLVP